MNIQWKWCMLLGVALTLGACGGGGSSATPGSISGMVDSSRVRPTSMGVVPGEVVVKFKSDLSLQRVDSLSVGGRALSLVRPLALERVQLFRAEGVSASETQRMVQMLAARSDVEWAEANTLDFPAAKPNDPFYKYQWHYPAMNLEAAWNISTGTAGMVVGVVDTGIFWDGDTSPNTHPDFVGKVLPGYDFVSDADNAKDGDGRDPNPYEPLEAGRESSDHGSHVAGTIAASTNNNDGAAGVNWQAKIVPVRVLGAGGGSIVDIAEGAMWAAGIPIPGLPNNPNPAKVINLSIGGENPCGNVYQEAFDQIAAAGVIVVVAAGNEDFDASRSRPANCNNVITVGATEISGNRAPYSNYGARIDVMAPGGNTAQVLTVDQVNLEAGVLSMGRNYQTGNPNAHMLNGTSMAAPHIAGLLSIMKGLQPSLTTAQALTILKNSARPLSALQCGQPNGCGAGLVDAAKSLAAVQSAPPPPPPPAAPPTTTAKRYVLALYQVGNDFDLNKSKGQEVNALSERTAFSLSGLDPALYTVAALSDLNDNGDLDSGEPLGAVDNVAVQSGKDTSSVVVFLQTLQFQKQSLIPASNYQEPLRQAINRVLQRR